MSTARDRRQRQIAVTGAIGHEHFMTGVRMLYACRYRDAVNHFQEAIMLEPAAKGRPLQAGRALQEVQRRRAALPAVDRDRVPPSRALPQSGRGIPAGEPRQGRHQGVQPGALLESEFRSIERRAPEAWGPEAARRAGSSPQPPDQHHARESPPRRKEARRQTPPRDPVPLVRQ